MEKISSLISVRPNGDYQRENFDRFLSEESFSFTIPAIHVAGTNGKGSTATYISEIYRDSGLKVGLFTSPAFYQINECIVVNDVQITNEEIQNILDLHRKSIEKHDLSSFEILTFVAYEHFKNMACDIVIIECGMGGEFDATNIINNELAVITSISLEHTNFLGKTLSEIAIHKSGIITEEKPVILGKLPGEALDQITTICKEKKSKIINIGEPFNIISSIDGTTFSYGLISQICIKNPAEYSCFDACLAIEAVKTLSDKFTVSEENILRGLVNTKLPLRMEIISKEPLIIIDGGHNPEAIRLLKNSCLKLIDKPIKILFACFKDKNLPSILMELGEISNDITLTTFDNERARQMEDYFLYLEDYKFENDCKTAINSLITENPDSAFLITGSLAFAAHMKKILNEK